MKQHNSTVVLLSGGMDSATCLYIAKQEYSKIYTLSFDYGQRHKLELKKAKLLSKLTDSEHHIIKVSPGLFQGSSLTDPGIRVPKNKLKHHIKTNTIPNTYVPARNLLFLSYALSFAESRNAESIYIGVNALDYSGYPDCRPGFIQAFQNAIREGTKRGITGNPVEIRTPLISLTKQEIVRWGNRLNVPYHHTFSCYDPDPITGKACGKCDACLLRKLAFDP